jgi:Tfp pilus assembly ATPase PilU
MTISGVEFSVFAEKAGKSRVWAVFSQTRERMVFRQINEYPSRINVLFRIRIIKGKHPR